MPPQSNPYYVLCDLAVAQAKVGDLEDSNKTFQQLLKTASPMADKFWKLHTLLGIAAAQIGAGNRAAALQTIDSVSQLIAENERKGKPQDTEAFQNERGTIAILQARAGDIRAAFQTVGSIKSDYQRARALAGIGREQAAAGNVAAAPATFQEALRIAPASVLIEIAEDQAKFGYRAEAAAALDEALRRASASKDFATKVRLLQDVAVAKAKLGQVEEALKIAQSIQNTLVRESALAGIAEVQAQAGAIDGALQTLAAVEEGETRDYALEEIALAQAKAGDFAAALQNAASVGRRLQIYVLLRRIATEQAKAGDVEEALAWARKEDSPERKTWALVGVAEGLLERTSALQ
jgi:tetratricopeptide (TPR) repeat protein